MIVLKHEIELIRISLQARGDLDLNERLALVAPTVQRKLRGAPVLPVERARRNLALHSSAISADELRTMTQRQMNHAQRQRRQRAPMPGTPSNDPWCAVHSSPAGTGPRPGTRFADERDVGGPTVTDAISPSAPHSEWRIPPRGPRLGCPGGGGVWSDREGVFVGPDVDIARS